MMRRAVAVAAAMLLASSAAAQSPRQLQIAITVDDLPVHGSYPAGVTPRQVSNEMLAALKAHHVPATGFVNAVKVQDEPDTQRVLRDWRDAGMLLGNHTWSHRHLSEMTLAEFEQEVTKNEPTLAGLGGRSDWRWLRYPFLDEGKDAQQRAAAREILAKHGYRVAAVSLSFGDWQWTAPYARCASAHDKRAVAELERMYMAAAREDLQVSRDAAHKLFGRDVPLVLLMHVSAMSARMMPQVIQLYRGAGARFVTLAQAERDPVYRSYTDLSLPAPPSPQELAQNKGVKLTRHTDYSARLDAMCPAAH